jgi:hypothetical protein
LKPIHCVSLSWSCLSIGKDSDNSLVEYKIENRTNLIEI